MNSAANFSRSNALRGKRWAKRLPGAWGRVIALKGSRLFSKLLNNSAKYTEQSGQIQLSVRGHWLTEKLGTEK